MNNKAFAVLGEFKNSVLAGISIALGGVVFLQCENRLLGAFLFSIGLYSVLVFGFDLFTGKVCFTENYKDPAKLAKVWIGNFIGAAFISLIMLSHSQLAAKAQEIAAAKVSKSLWNVLIDGVICGICIAVAVKGYRRAEGAGRYLAVILGVMVFILAGSEHVVANMFYLTVAGNVPIGQYLLFLLVNTVGNTLGGLLFSKI